MACQMVRDARARRFRLQPHPSFKSFLSVLVNSSTREYSVLYICRTARQVKTAPSESA